MNSKENFKNFVSIKLLILFLVLIILFTFYFNSQVKSGKLFKPKLTNNQLAIDDISLLITTSQPIDIYDFKNLTSTGQIKEATNIQLQVEDLVIITEFNIVPSVLTVNKGSKVTWINNSNKSVWLTSLKDSKSLLFKCSPNIFDSCKEIKPKEKWSFVFSEVGKWEYYDRLNSSLNGKIIVK